MRVLVDMLALTLCVNAIGPGFFFSVSKRREALRNQKHLDETREQRYKRMYLAVKNTFESSELHVSGAVSGFDPFISQGNLCMQISMAIEMLCAEWNAERKGKKPKFENLRAVRIKYGKYYHVSTRTPNGDILDFQGYLDDKEYPSSNYDLLKLPRMPSMEMFFNNRHFYVRDGWHKEFAGYLFDSFGFLQLSDATLKLINENLADENMKNILENRKMGDQIIVAMMSSEQCWQAVAKETGITIEYMPDVQSERWVIDTISKLIQKNYEILEKCPELTQVLISNEEHKRNLAIAKKNICCNAIAEYDARLKMQADKSRKEPVWTVPALIKEGDKVCHNLGATSRDADRMVMPLLS